MPDVERIWSLLQERHPLLLAVACFVFVLAILVVLGWYLLFSGLGSSGATFIYNQF
ncbi:MAG: hypothetical protein LBG81_01455 [Coriobacteriaceae bacterium]|jgi:hypothetical protein|nr:hypothetical protein [Coriobacteriaceae bacterium]